MPERKRSALLYLRLFLVVLLGVAGFLVWLAALSQPDERLRVFFLDVGQGDAILIQSPSGATMLVDGGPSPSAILDLLDRHLAFWSRSLDLVVSTHPDEDHLSGLTYVPQRYRVHTALESGHQPATGLYNIWLGALRRQGIEPIKATAGQRIDLGGGVHAEVLHPTQPVTYQRSNDASVVLKVWLDEMSILLTGDIGPEVQTRLVRSGAHLRSTILKVPHQGAADALGEDFLQAVQPEVAIISAGLGNRFGHPAQVTLDKLRDAHSRIYRTDQDGTIELYTDGHGYEVRPYKQAQVP